MLNAARARKFVEEFLHIRDLPLVLGKQDGRLRLQLLDELCRAFVNTVPFHNLRLMSLPMSERAIPSVGDCAAACLRGEGGLCWTLNCFFFQLLQTLDFDVSPLLCSVAVPGAGDHIAVRADNVFKAGDQYLVDVGFGIPSFQAISLDFEKESSVFCNSFNTSKLARDGSGQFVRLHKTRKTEGSKSSFPTVVDGWAHAYYFHNQPVSLDTIMESIGEHIYRNPQDHFNRQLRFITFRDNLAVSLKDYLWLRESREEVGKLVPSEVDSDANIVQGISRESPNIPIDVIEKAVENRRLQMDGS